MSILVRAENLVEELRQLKNQTIKHRPKRAIREHYSDLHCLQKFETSEQTIIRTVESQKNGAVFINVTTLESFELCLASCCETSLCNVAIFDESVSFPYYIFKTFKGKYIVKWLSARL